MNIEEETIQKMKSITASLSDLELLLSNNGYKCPEKQLHIERNNKITLPFGYIRKADQFRIDYNLFKLIDDRTVINNIAYSLQMSDFYNYVLNRFNIFLSIDQYFTKYAITNIFSSFEALLFASVAKLHKFCISKDGVICSKCNKCSYYINSVNQFKFKNLLDLYIEKIGISIFYEEKQPFY